MHESMHDVHDVHDVHECMNVRAFVPHSHSRVSR